MQNLLFEKRNISAPLQKCINIFPHKFEIFGFFEHKNYVHLFVTNKNVYIEPNQLNGQFFRSAPQISTLRQVVQSTI